MRHFLLVLALLFMFPMVSMAADEDTDPWMDVYDGMCPYGDVVIVDTSNQKSNQIYDCLNYDPVQKKWVVFDIKTVNHLPVKREQTIKSFPPNIRAIKLYTMYGQMGISDDGKVLVKPEGEKDFRPWEEKSNDR